MSNTDPNRCACGNRKPINRAVCTECPEPSEAAQIADALREPVDREGDAHEFREGAD